MDRTNCKHEKDMEKDKIEIIQEHITFNYKCFQDNKDIYRVYTVSEECRHTCVLLVT